MTDKEIDVRINELHCEAKRLRDSKDYCTEVLNDKLKEIYAEIARLEKSSSEYN